MIVNKKINKAVFNNYNQQLLPLMEMLKIK